MGQKLAFGFAVGCLVAIAGTGCDPETNHTACVVDPADLSIEEDPAPHADRFELTAEGTVRFVADGTANKARWSVDEVSNVRRSRAQDCTDDWVYSADVVASLTWGDDVVVALPSRLSWRDDSTSLNVGSGLFEADALGVNVPFEPPQGWVLAGIEVRGGCSEPVVVDAWLARDVCDDPTDCVHETFVEIATVTLPEGNSLCRL